jgi:hypothetical protein
MNFIYNDGGRADAGFKGKAGDCVVRAIAIATGEKYKNVYNMVASANKDFGFAKSARNGIHKSVSADVLKKLGFQWYSAPKFIGRKARPFDMPRGVVIAKQAHHLVAVINGVPYDTFDSTVKIIYGYWKK